MHVERRTFLRSAVGAAGALLVAGSLGPTTVGATELAGAPRRRPTVRLGFGAFGFPSPFASNGTPGYLQMILLYDTLLWKDSTGDLLPWLARRVRRSNDGLTYTFELREARWSDGMPLTAADVAFTFEYYGAQRSLSPPVIIQPPQGIAGVTANGPREVVITLEEPIVTFAEEVAGALPIIPEHIWSKVSGDPNEAQTLDVLVGSGPYRLESYDGDGEGLLYTARDDYFLGKPFVQRVEMSQVGDELAALMAGDISAGGTFSNGLRPTALAPFRADDSFGIIEEKASSTSPLYWNLDKGGALADVRFRQACARAIDRRDLVKRFTGGNGEPGNPGFLAPTNPFYARVEQQYRFDRRKAEQLLDRAGYRRTEGRIRQGPDGEPLSFELLTPNDSASVALGEVVSGALRTVGVELRPRPLEIGPQLFGSKLAGNYDMAILVYPGPVAGGPNADPDLLRRLFSSESPPSLTGASGYANPEFDSLAARQLTTSDEGARRRIVAEMQQILARDLPILPLLFEDAFQIFRKEVLRGWYVTPGQYPASFTNKQLFVTGRKTGAKVRR